MSDLSDLAMFIMMFWLFLAYGIKSLFKIFRFRTKQYTNSRFGNTKEALDNGLE
jgi:hypothetical protein